MISFLRPVFHGRHDVDTENQSVPVKQPNLSPILITTVRDIGRNVQVYMLACLVY